MRNFFCILVAISILGGCASDVIVEHQDKSAYTITTSPAETNDSQMNFSWATDTTITSALLEVTRINDKNWKKSIIKEIEGELCTIFDSVYSKSHEGENIYEDVVINKYNGNIDGLESDTHYKYRIITTDTSSVHYFHTAGAKEWEACIISDFHVYSPIYARTKSAMDMITTVENYHPFDWILHLGDITAWGGSYTFWKDLYKETPFLKYMWAGVNGNHDNMTRGYIRTTNEFFRHTATYPQNGYPGEEGVCYHFKYGDVLFIMLNNESMKDSLGLAAAQQWVRDVVSQNPAPYKVVCEHYQWFFGKDGKDSQYGRWSKLFDELGINLALAGNNHIYVSTPAIYNGEVTDGSKGTVYIQTPSSDNERGVAYDAQTPPVENGDKIKFRWSEGPNTVGAMHMSVTPEKMTLVLLDRNGNVLDTNYVFPSKQ